MRHCVLPFSLDGVRAAGVQQTGEADDALGKSRIPVTQAAEIVAGLQQLAEQHAAALFQQPQRQRWLPSAQGGSRGVGGQTGETVEVAFPVGAAQRARRGPWQQLDGTSVRADLWVPRTLSCHATCTYS